MKVVLEGDTQLVLEDFEGPGLHVEAAEGVHAHFSAFEMFVSGVGLCTASVLGAYAEQLEVPTGGLRVRMRWELDVAPRRMGAMQMDIQWPELPPSRTRAAELAASQCPLHQTLAQPTSVTTRVFAGEQAARQEARARAQREQERHAHGHHPHAHDHEHPVH